MKYNERIILSEDNANYYIIYLLENYMFWQNTFCVYNKDLKEWTFSGLVDYHGQKQKIIKIIKLCDYIKLLKTSLKIKKGYNVEQIDYNYNDKYKFVIKYNLVNDYCLSRRRR